MVVLRVERLRWKRRLLSSILLLLNSRLRVALTASSGHTLSGTEKTCSRYSRSSLLVLVLLLLLLSFSSYSNGSYSNISIKRLHV